MAKNTNGCKELVSVQLCDHATSRLQIVALDIRNLCVTHPNEIMHLNMVFNWVEDGLGKSIGWLKDWHETMLKHANSCNKRIQEQSNALNLKERITKNNIPCSLHLWLLIG
jgi:hypothetical protein